jgi:6-phosphogluconolactonase
VAQRSAGGADTPSRAGASVRVLAGARELAGAAVELVLTAARAVIAERGAFHLALAGGSTPRATYAELARQAGVAFEHWHLWFGDERCVPPGDEHSNYRMVAESGLLARVPAPRVHRMRGEGPDPSDEARRYEHELEAVLGQPPRLDLALLGLGSDGHTASLFPGTAALEARGWVTVGRAPTPPEVRLSLTLSALAEARAAAFLVAGADKALVLARVLGAARGAEVPAALVRPRAGTLVWLVERSAAQDL